MLNLDENSIIITSDSNLIYLKKKLFELNKHESIKVYSKNSFYSKLSYHPISKMKQEMFFIKSLHEASITEFNFEVLADIMEIYRDEAIYNLNVKNMTDNYMDYKKVIDVYLSYHLDDFESSIKYLMESDISFNKKIYLYDVYLNEADKVIFNKFNYEIINYEKKGNFFLFEANDLYEEVIFTANKIAELSDEDFSSFAIVSNNINQYKNYIELIFNNNNIPVNFSTLVNASYIEYLISIIDKKDDKFNYENKDLFFKSLIDFINVDENTKKFIVDICASYYECFSDITLFTKFLDYYKTKEINKKHLNRVDVCDIKDVSLDKKYLFVLGVNEGEFNVSSFNNLFIKYNELFKIYDNFNVNTFKDEFDFYLNRIEYFNFVYFTYHKIDFSNNQSKADLYLNGLNLTKVKLNIVLENVYNVLANDFILNKTNLLDVNRLDLNFDELNLSPSKLDTFNKCNFSFYCKYLLKLDEPYVEFDNRHIGSYVHKLFELSLNSTDYIKEFKNEEELYSSNFKSPIIKYLISKITENVITLFPYVKRELDANGFENKYREIDLKSDPLVIDLNGININVSGIIDRVDESDSSFRIVDYKTGNRTLDFNEMIIGINLQLFIYMLYLEKKYDKKVSGLLYQKALIVSKKDSYLLDGIILDSAIDLYGGDDVSEFLNVKSRGNIDSNKVLNESKFELISNYTMKKIKDSANNILSGNITINPINGTCDYCPFKVICGIEDKRGRAVVKRDDVFKDMEDELNGVY